MSKIITKNQQSIFDVLYFSFWLYIFSALSGASLVQEGVLIVLIILYLCLLMLRTSNRKCIIDLLCFVLLITWYNLGLIKCGKISEEYYIFNLICSIIVTVASVVFLVSNMKIRKMLDFFKIIWPVVLIILIFFGFSFETIDSWAMWDARVYYAFPYSSVDIQGIVESFESNFRVIYDLFIAGHAGVGYSLWLMLFQMMNQSYKMVQIADIILACISIYAYFWIVMLFIHGSRKKMLAAIATLPYAFSPFILGMVGNINLDSITTYFLVIFVACSLYEMNYMEIVMATALCFTKETAVVYYFAYIIGKVLFEYKQKEKFGLKQLMQVSIGNLKNYIYAIPVIAWGILYHLNPTGGWSNGEETGILWNSEGMHCFGININVIITKLKQIFLLDFNWIFWAVILLVLFVILFIKKRDAYSKVQVLFPLCLTGISVMIFGVLYITCTHARYIIPMIPSLYLVSTALLSNQRRTLFMFSGGVSIILLVQSFWGIDPIMKIAFPSQSVGEATIYSMYEYNTMEFSDCIIYNRQYQYWGEVLEMVLQDAGYDGEMLIVLPDDKNCTRYCLFGDHETLWDKGTNQLEYYNEHLLLTAQQKKIQVASLREIDGIECESNKKLYIIPVWGSISEEFLSEKSIEKHEIITWKGYTIQYFLLSEK